MLHEAKLIEGANFGCTPPSKPRKVYLTVTYSQVVWKPVTEYLNTWIDHLYFQMFNALHLIYWKILYLSVSRHAQIISFLRNH